MAKQFTKPSPYLVYSRILMPPLSRVSKPTQLHTLPVTYLLQAHLQVRCHHRPRHPALLRPVPVHRVRSASCEGVDLFRACRAGDHPSSYRRHGPVDEARPPNPAVPRAWSCRRREEGARTDHPTRGLQQCARVCTWPLAARWTLDSSCLGNAAPDYQERRHGRRRPSAGHE